MRFWHSQAVHNSYVALRHGLDIWLGNAYLSSSVLCPESQGDAWPSVGSVLRVMLSWVCRIYIFYVYNML